MGDVYKARDTRLGRLVAIKVLPDDLASDAMRLHRFEQEARAASELNHPNIVTVYDFGVCDSTHYMAMELVDGQTLKKAVSNPLPAKRLLEIALPVAEALATAHQHGIVHRDLKPDNVMVSREGFVKLLDFGVAKSLPRDEDERIGSVITSTYPGVLVGTAEYMSPEQATGQNVGFHSDQFSFGVVLYELATAIRPFRRPTTAETLAAIEQEEPKRLSEVRPDLPAPLRWTIERCLAKNPEGRFASTHDLARELATIRDHLPEIGAAARPTARPWWGTGLAVVLGAVVVGGLYVDRRSPKPQPVLRFSVYPPPRGAFETESSTPAPVAVSPDARQMVFGVRDNAGRSQLWLRVLDATDAHPLEGTDDATYPFWSPDSRYIGFFSEGKLKKVDAAGGPVQILSEAPNGRGGTWGRDGFILFAPASQGPICRVSAVGGSSTPITEAAPAASHRWPHLLPDGRHFLFRISGSGSRHGIAVTAIGSKEIEVLVPDASNALYAEPGYLLFSRGGTLMAVPFDAANARLNGDAVPIAERISDHPYRGNAAFSVSGGLLAYQPASNSSRLTWIDRSGRSTATAQPPGDYGGLRLSPDGRRCLVEARDVRTRVIGVWMLDLTRAVQTRLTAGSRISESAAWAPDGTEVIFASDRDGHSDLYKKSSSGAGPEERVFQSGIDKLPTDWSTDGKYVVFNGTGRDQPDWDLWLFSFETRQAAPLVQTAFDERDGRLSADRRWLAFSSTETGAREVYVTSFPKPGGKVRISPGGGIQPVWRGDGKELFFIAADDRLMAVGVRADPTFEAGTPQPLFEARLRTSASDMTLYDAAADGSRFLMNVPDESLAPTPINVVVNWTALIRR
jgi:serine/threonine protein kinase